MKETMEPTLFDFNEEEKQNNDQIEVSFAEKADWKNENGEEVCFFIEKDETLNVISNGLSKNYDGHGHYNNTDKSFHGFILEKEHRTISLLQAIAHPNEKNINLLTDDERHEFNLIMRNINPEYKKAYESKLERERRDREANAGKNATNYVLSRLKAAGIETVTDKEEFDRILERENYLQMMSLVSTEPETIESLFTSKNEENLDSEIDKLTEKDVSLKDDFITISEKTPFIFKEFGLGDFPVNMYKQKLARAFFLEEQKFGERITHGHKGEFTSKTVKDVLKNLGNPRYIFNSKQNLSNPENFYLIGVYDELDEQKNPMVLSLHFNKNRKEIEANWITSIYGKRKNILVNDWTQKGYLVYMNDLEMEKAPAEVVTLQMRVSKSASAYIDNVKKKSDFVNDFDVAFNKNQENVYGFAYNGKIYLNPDFLTSNVAVHEYTHLWDEYTRRTNPELWQKGMSILKDTKLFAEVKNDLNYADIANDDNLVLSEVHARICGTLAQKYLERIAKEEGEIKSISAAEWNKEVAEYVEKELFPKREIFRQRHHTDGIKENEIDGDAIERFLATPMADLAKGLSLRNRDFETRFRNGDFTEVFERLSDINFKADIYKTMPKEEQKKEYEKLWSELFPDGEPKEIQEKRENWRQRIKEYENELKLPETLEKAKAQAKKMPAETIKERLEQYKKNEHGFYPRTAEEAAERNEAEFKNDILNTLGKLHSSYDHWLDWNNVDIHVGAEPVSNTATDIRISVLENELKERGISIEKEKLMTKEEIIDYYVAHNNDRKTGRFDSYKSMMIDWKDFVENLYMSDAITEKQKDSLAGPCTEKDFEKFNERFESNVKQKVTKEHENDYDETTEIEKFYAEVNPNGGNDRGFQFGVKDFDHLKNIKRLLDDFKKNPPKHSELEDLEKSERRYSRESKRLQKIYENEHDKDALKGAQKNADYANFYHWQVEKLNKDIVQHPNKFDSIKTWYEKSYPSDKETVEKMSEFATFGQLEIDIKNGAFGRETYSKTYGEYDSLVRERMFQKLAEMNNVGYDVVYDAWLHAEDKPEKTITLDDKQDKSADKNAPFEIFYNKETYRVNIRFNPESKTPHLNEIRKELKANGWKYAPSKGQWYPIDVQHNPSEFAEKLLEKYTEKKEEPEIKAEEQKAVKETDFAEKLSENKSSPYDGIKFFDRNYLETKDFTTYFNAHIDSFGKGKPLLSEKDAKYILRALNHLDTGFIEQRSDRLGLDSEGKLVIFSRKQDEINVTKTDLKGVVKAAKEMSEESLEEAKAALKKHSEKNILEDSLKSIFTKMYTDCVFQCEDVKNNMEEIFEKYNLQQNIERKAVIKPLSVGETIGNDFVSDVYKISDGVYQATLSQKIGDALSSQNYFVVDSNVAEKCRPEIIELMENNNGRFVVQNKNNEPYILKELISKNLMPPRDESFVQMLDEFIEKHPEKYAKLYPISPFNFSEKLNELANIDKELTKNPLLCGKKLISLVNESEKKNISSFLKKNGCVDDSSMKKVFAEWMRTPQIEKAEQRKIKKNDGYPPRGA